MKKIVRVLAACAIALTAQGAWATPSTVFWTPATTYVQPFLLPHLGMDVYFNDKAYYPINLGFTMGVLPFEKIQAEVGLDFFFPYWGPQNAVFLSPAGALQLNAKVGTPEGSFAEWSPGISGGIYGVGLNQATQFSILHAEIGKTFFFGNLTAGGYYGAGGVGALWSDVDGAPVNKVYCNSVTMDAVQQTIDVTCDGDLDIPLSGSCDAVGKPGTYTLCFNTPQFWSGPRTGQPAMWSCGWCSATGFVNLQGAKAWMCCVRP